MTDAGTDTKAPAFAPVKPSSRDPITQWLDVFTSLLSLPAGEAERIRDELEDHLRTRVDDLLILGMTEPEAVQKAVTELGETAQLAQNFKSVRIHSRRRIAMYTALFAAAGLALTVSVAGLLPRATTAPVPNAPAIVDVQPETEKRNGYLDRDLPEGTLDDLFLILAESGDARLFVHWGMLANVGLDRETEVPAIPSKGLQHSKVKQLLNSTLNLHGAAQIDARYEDGLLEIAPREYFDRTETITIDHDVSDLVYSSHVLERTREGMNLVESIQAMVEPDIWEDNGGTASISLNGSSIGVRAPERIQSMVIDYVAKLVSAQRQRDAESKQELIQHQTADYERKKVQFEDLNNHRDQLMSQINFLQGQVYVTSIEVLRQEYELKDLEVEYAMAEDSELRAEIRERLVKLGGGIERSKLRSVLHKEELGQLQSSLRAIEEERERLSTELYRHESAGR